MLAQRRLEAVPVQRPRMQLDHQTTKAPRGSGHDRQDAVHFGFEGWADRSAEHLQPKFRCGHLLDGIIVKITGDTGSFFLLGRDELTKEEPPLLGRLPQVVEACLQFLLRLDALRYGIVELPLAAVCRAADHVR